MKRLLRRHAVGYIRRLTHWADASQCSILRSRRIHERKASTKEGCGEKDRAQASHAESGEEGSAHCSLEARCTKGRSGKEGWASLGASSRPFRRSLPLTISSHHTLTRLPKYESSVFLNVPFDSKYEKLRDALVFVVHACGFTARCALERDDSGEIRIDKIFDIIQKCQFGIHDLSRTTLDSTNRLPRFNMPLELGVFLGARRFGDQEQRRKVCLILDSEKWRYQKFCSDIAGQDIRAHGNNVERAIGQVRNWLTTHATNPLPGPRSLATRYFAFTQELPELCEAAAITRRELTFGDYSTFVTAWLESEEEARKSSRNHIS